MTQTIKAIETSYKGYRFRSRLEARWAVFFDALGWEYEYEPEGFDLGQEGWYLPDFRLIGGRETDVHGWFEIKPTMASIDKDEKRKMIAFDKSIPWPRLQILIGNPWPREHYVSRFWDSEFESKLSGEKVFCRCPLCGVTTISDVFPLQMHTTAIFCENCDIGTLGLERKQHPDAWFHKGNVESRDLLIFEMDPVLLTAFTAARSARFEHGENPR